MGKKHHPKKNIQADSTNIRIFIVIWKVIGIIHLPLQEISRSAPAIPSPKTTALSPMITAPVTNALSPMTAPITTAPVTTVHITAALATTPPLLQRSNPPNNVFRAVHSVGISSSEESDIE
jgi:hypothetical protein